MAFDVSHLGTVRVDGRGGLRPAAADAHQRPAQDRARPGPVHPPARTTTARWPTTSSCGGWPTERFDVMPNASNTGAGAWPPSAAGTPPPTRAVVAVQGPDGPRRLRGRSPPRRPPSAASRWRPFEWRGAAVPGRGHRLHRRGRGGVRGARPTAAPAFCRAVLGAGVAPAGLGARDTLRLEAGLPAARPRARPGHHAPPGRPGLGGGLGQGRLPRAPAPSRPSGRAGRAAAAGPAGRGAPAAARRGRVVARGARRWAR